MAYIEAILNEDGSVYNPQKIRLQKNGIHYIHLANMKVIIACFVGTVGLEIIGSVQKKIERFMSSGLKNIMNTSLLITI